MKKKTQTNIRLKDLILISKANKVGFALIFVVVIVVIIHIFSGSKDNNKLKNEGVSIKGIVIEKRTPGYRGIVNTYYKFYVNGNMYEGHSDVDDNINIGDSIDIIYWKYDPSLNKSKSMME